MAVGTPSGQERHEFSISAVGLLTVLRRAGAALGAAVLPAPAPYRAMVRVRRARGPAVHARR
jgi:hypothetical protein